MTTAQICTMTERRIAAAHALDARALRYFRAGDRPRALRAWRAGDRLLLNQIRRLARCL